MIASSAKVLSVVDRIGWVLLAGQMFQNHTSKLGHSIRKHLATSAIGRLLLNEIGTANFSVHYIAGPFYVVVN